METIKKVFEYLAELQNHNMLRASALGGWPRLPTLPVKVTLVQRMKEQEAGVTLCDENELQRKMFNKCWPEVTKENPIDMAVKEALSGKAVTMAIDALLSKWMGNESESQGTIEAELIQRSNLGTVLRTKEAQIKTRELAIRTVRTEKEHWLFQNVMIFRKGRSEGYKIMKNPVMIAVVIMFPEESVGVCTKKEKEVFKRDSERKTNEERIRTAIQQIALLQEHSGEIRRQPLSEYMVQKQDACQGMVSAKRW